MTFYSQGGRKRLDKIWKDNNLDKEMIFSSWIGVGPSRTLILETVSDYIQNFLSFKNQSVYLKMNLRLMLMHHSIALSPSQHSACRALDTDKEADDESEKRKHFNFQKVTGIHDCVYQAKTNQRVQEREQEEQKRIWGLIVDEKLEAPKGFKSPLLTLNGVNRKLEALERHQRRYGSQMTFGECPAIRNYDRGVDQTLKNMESREDYYNGGISCPGTVLSLPSSTKLIAEEKDSSSASGDSDYPPATIQIKIEVTWESETKEKGNYMDWEIPLFHEMAYNWGREEDNSRSYSQDIEDSEIFTGAQDCDDYGASGEVDFSMDFPDLPLLVKDVMESQDIYTMFDKSHEVITAYRRQLVQANDEVKKLSRLINPYFFT